MLNSFCCRENPTVVKQEMPFSKEPLSARSATDIIKKNIQLVICEFFL